MADNTTLNTGSGGDVISTDDIAGVKVQRVKVQYGVDGSATDVSDSNPLPIDDAGGSLTVDGTVTANLGATDNAVLDAIAASLVDVETNTNSGAVVGGGAEATALRVTLANDSTGVVSVDDGGGALTVDGTVTANLSATDNAVLDNIDTNTGYGAVVGGGAEATALRVTLANDSTGVVSIDDNGGSLTVDGTVTANLSATDNAVLDAIAADTSTLATGISGFSSIDLDESEEQIKGSAGTLYTVYAWNATAAPLWLQIFDNTAAGVTVGTTAPTYNFPIPANADSDVAGVVIPLPPQGLAFSTGITMAATTGSGTTAGAPGANEAGVFVTYS